MSTFERHVIIEEPNQKVADVVAQQCEWTKTLAKQVMQAGAVWLTRGQHTRRIRRASTVLQVGDEVHVYYDPASLNAEVPAAELVADEGDYSVWRKPAGMYSQGSKWGDNHTLQRWAEQQLQPARIAKVVHRLDRFTSGLMLLAHSKRAAAYFAEQFSERQVTKHYTAIVQGEWGVIGQQVELYSQVDGKAARSLVTIQQQAAGRSQVAVQIFTGRKHQVRVHLASAGYPIVGDRLFMDQLHDPHTVYDLQLCATQLSFICPDQMERSYVLEPPESFAELMSAVD